MVRFSPGRVRNPVGKLATVRGSSIWMSTVFVVNMYVAAATVPSRRSFLFTASALRSI